MDVNAARAVAELKLSMKRIFAESALKVTHAIAITGRRGHYERGGSFTGGFSRITKTSKFSRISRRWSDSPLFSTVWRFSKTSRISKFPRINL